ncbi:MAG: pyridoxal phosphate-dependent aminotransferase [Atopobiaceae bacterium]|jgi:aspartate/methionine/tyrosine aminotransferase
MMFDALKEVFVPTINEQLSHLMPSGIRRFTQLAAKTPGCIPLTLGEPADATADTIKAEVTQDLAADYTHYPPNRGYDFLREAIAQFESSSLPQSLSRPENVIVTAGATEALAVACALMLNPGDEVVILSPAFSLYESLVVLNRGVVKRLDTAPSGFQVSYEALSSVVGPRCKAIVLCSPNNPSGSVLNSASLDAIAAVAGEKDLFVVCDDVYAKLVYTPKYQRFSERHPELADRTLVVGSFSKPYAMCGWRLGWLIGPGALMEEAAKIHQYYVSSVPAFVQHAAQVALKQDVAPLVLQYQEKRDLVAERLCAMHLLATTPDGAFYAFPCIREFDMSSEEFCERAIREAGVALVPGVYFGAEHYVRLSFACSKPVLTSGLERLEHFVKSQRKVH